MEISFKGMRALVTGAGRDNGRAIAKALWTAGATVFALSRRQDHLDTLKTECAGMNVVCVDLMNWKATQEAVAGCGAIDLLVNNAATWMESSVVNTTEEAFDVLFSTNVKAVVNVTQMVARGMVERKKGGSIVNVSSIGSRRALDLDYVFCTSKAALDHLTRCMAVELGPHQIRVNSINPTVVKETEMGKFAMEEEPAALKKIMDRTPMGRMNNLQNICNTTMYLLSDKADMINGALLNIDGGFWCT